MSDLALEGYEFVRRRVLDGLAEVGRVSLLVFETIGSLGTGIRQYRLVLEQMDAVGVKSLMLVVIVSLFTGAVSAVQAAYQFSSVVPAKFIGSVILRSVIIELGPVLTALSILASKRAKGPTSTSCARPGCITSVTMSRS